MDRYCPYRIAFLFGTPVAAIALTIYYVSTQPFNWMIWAMAAVLYAATAGSITAGYHRLFAHRTYQANLFVKWIYVLFGAASLQNSIYTWARDHRVHHRFADTDLDPYSINKGFWWAHIGWMLRAGGPDVDLDLYGKDFEQDKLVMFQHKYYGIIAPFMCFAFPTLLGWAMGSALGGLAIGGFLRLVLVHHATFFINSWCHTWGRQTYTDKQTARDSFIMAVATFGEGYHNFHHLFANDYRNGVKWYHWDPTKWWIGFCHWLGAVSDLQRTPQKRILEAQMAMDEKRAKSSWSAAWHHSFQEQLDALRTKINAAHQRFEQLKSEYHTLKEHYAHYGHSRMRLARVQVRTARSEFKAARRQWRAYNAQLIRASRQQMVA